MRLERQFGDVESFAKHYKGYYIVIPAKAGIQCFQLNIDSGSSPE